MELFFFLQRSQLLLPLSRLLKPLLPMEEAIKLLNSSEGNAPLNRKALEDYLGHVNGGVDKLKVSPTAS